MTVKEYRKQQSWCSIAAKKLRQKATKAEIVFRTKLLDAGFRDIHFQKFFRTEKEIVIADFFLKKSCVVIELDGSIHGRADVMMNDLRKDNFYRKCGKVYGVIHLSNSQAFSINPNQILALVKSVKIGEILYCY